ncbi:MAG: glutathione S-transferase family protein [Candidatus Melainabacteria bacterium]|nr:glutathione S-transferase family protein [Candidatus Melainabacteria bacterium]
MSKLVLYDHIESQNGYKVRLALSNLKIAYEFRQMDMMGGEHKKDWFLKLNPHGKIPTIQDGDVSVWESNAILLYLGRRFAPNNLIPQDVTKLGIMLEWIFFETSMLQTSLQPLRFISIFIPKEKQDQAEVIKLKEKSMKALKTLDEYLSKHKFLADDYSMADIACYGQIFPAPEFGLDMSQFKNIKEWQKRVESQPGYIEMRAKVVA